MTYGVSSDWEDPQTWKVHPLSESNDEGEGEVTIFTGPHARDRALEYATFKTLTTETE